MNRASISDNRPSAEEGRLQTLLVLLQRVWTYPITTKADLSREYADEIAEASSLGFLTTAIIPGRALHGRLWKMTPEGLLYLFENANVIADDEVANYVASFCEQ